MNRREELRKELEEIEKKEQDSLLSKYSWLVSKCLHRAHTSYEKIVSVDQAYANNGRFEICCTCIKVYYDNRGYEYNPFPKIKTNSFVEIHSDEIDEILITEDVFEKALNDCCACIKRISSNFTNNKNQQ